MTGSSCWPRSRGASTRAERRHAAWLASLLIATTPLAAQQPAGQLLPGNLPIELDAAWSELDRRSDRLLFRDLTVTQGDLRLKADEAIASPADFENSRWVFTGNVVMQSTDARVTAQRAEISFGAQRLQVIVLTGAPARFEQLAQRDGLPTAGRARLMEYDLTSGVVLMSGDAWLSDGSNEIAGARISYDLRNERVTADADETGQVRLRITPPERGEPTPEPQPAEPLDTRPDPATDTTP